MKNKYAFLQKIRPIELGIIFKKIFRVKRLVYESNSCSWWLDPASQFGVQVLGNGYYEKELSDYIVNTLKTDDIFVDLGANEGWFSVLAAKKVGPGGKVITIEPQERLWPVLIKNFFINQLYNYTLIPCAIGEEETERDMVLNPELNNGGSSFVYGIRNYFWTRQSTPIRKLDTIFNLCNLQRVNLMKVDIEGFEYFAIQSGARIFEQKIVERVVVDIHTTQLNALGISPQQIYGFFEQKGYRFIHENGIGVFITNVTI